MLQSRNPFLNRIEVQDSSYQATYTGVTLKVFLLLLIVASTALMFAVRGTFTSGTIVGVIFAPIIAMIAVIIAHRVPQFAMVASFVYAIAEGVFLGFISLLYASYYGGEIILTALYGTFGVFFSMLFLYFTGIIRVGDFFRRFMISALFGLIGVGLLMFIVSLFGGLSTAFFFSDIYLLFVVISVVLSSLFLLVDFDRINQYIEAGAGKEFEWSLALGLMVTIIWIYIEILRLVAVLSRRR